MTPFFFDDCCPSALVAKFVRISKPSVTCFFQLLLWIVCIGVDEKHIVETLIRLLETHKTELKSWEDAIEELQTRFLPAHGVSPSDDNLGSDALSCGSEVRLIHAYVNFVLDMQV